MIKPSLGQFDVVLCLGLLYHVNKPVGLIEAVSQVNSDLLVIDTGLSDLQGSVFEVRHESLDDPRNAVECELVLVPSAAAVTDVAVQFGYRVALPRPEFSDYTGCQDYEAGVRRAFLCAKRSDLSRVAEA